MAGSGAFTSCPARGSRKLQGVAAAHLVVPGVVDGAGVGAAGDHRRVCHALRSARFAPVLKHHRQLVLVHAWLGALYAARHGRRRQLGRVLHQRQLSGRLAPPAGGGGGASSVRGVRGQPGTMCTVPACRGSGSLPLAAAPDLQSFHPHSTPQHRHNNTHTSHLQPPLSSLGWPGPAPELVHERPQRLHALLRGGLLERGQLPHGAAFFSLCIVQHSRGVAQQAAQLGRQLQGSWGSAGAAR